MGVHDFKSIPNNNVPIIGAAKVFEWRPIVSIQCSCGTGQPMLITATDRAIRCDGCGKFYALAFLQYDVRQGQNANVGVMEVRQPAVNES